MRVIIETAVFTQPGTAVQLLHLFGLGLQKHHRIQVEDDQAPGFQAWLDGLNLQQREECQEVLDAGFELDGREPSRHELWVASPRVVPDLVSKPPRLPLARALQVLTRPFRVVVENRGADRSFLLCMCTPQQRDFLREHEQAGFVEFENGNGLESMDERAGVLKNELHAPLLYYFLFDSDALQVQQPSAQSERLRRTCERRGLPHYQLRRRFIESYVPLNAVRGWAYGGSRREVREQRGARFQAFAHLKPEQRHYYNVKHGFQGDAGRIAQGETPGTLFDDVPETDRRALENGLDRSLAELYAPPGQHVTEPDLRTDGGWAELNPVVSEIIARIR